MGKFKSKNDQKKTYLSYSYNAIWCCWYILKYNSYFVLIVRLQNRRFSVKYISSVLVGLANID